MNREFVEMSLAQAERHVAEGEVILARQRAAIAASERIGGDVARFKELLSVFEDSQRVHVTDRDRLRKDFQNASWSQRERADAVAEFLIEGNGVSGDSGPERDPSHSKDDTPFRAPKNTGQ